MAGALFQLFGCGSDDPQQPAGTGGVFGTGGVPAPGGAGGAPQTGGAGAGGAPASGGAVGSGGTTSSGGSVGAGAACGRGERTATNACYISCQFSPAAAPYYDQTNACAPIGWKCSELQYCNLTLKCATDATCAAYTGPGYKCIDATGPLQGQCALACTTNADCPPPHPVTKTPYSCGPAQTNAGVINVCRFAGTM